MEYKKYDNTFNKVKNFIHYNKNYKYYYNNDIFIDFLSYKNNE